MFGKRKTAAFLAALMLLMFPAAAGCSAEKDPAEEPLTQESVSLTETETEPKTEEPETEESGQVTTTESETTDVYEGYYTFAGEAPDTYHLVYENAFSGSIKGECVVDEGALGIVFYADDDITNVGVYTLSFDGEQLAETEQKLGPESLKAGEGICIHTYIPDVIPNVLISFTDSGNVNRNYLLSQSGKDGRLILYEKAQ